jgi:integrin alpha 7
LFQVNNDGPWRAPYFEVDIDWPFQVGNDKPLGKWLLYLEDTPLIEGAGGGDCAVQNFTETVNPLHLDKRPQGIALMSEPLMEDPVLLRRSNKSHTITQYKQKVTYEEKSSTTNENSILNRVKRDRSMIIRSDKLVDSDGKKTNIVTMVSMLDGF